MQGSSAVTAGAEPSTARGRRTRAALIQAARETFEEGGFHDAKVADIATRAGVAYGSFYSYFGSKEEVFRAVVSAVVGDMFVASRSGGSDEDPLARIEAANRRFLAAYARNAAILRVLEEVVPYDGAFRQLRLEVRNLFVSRSERGIRRLQETGEADPDLDAALAASLLGGMVERAAYLWFVLGEEYDEESGVAALTRLWAQAIQLRPRPR